MDDTSRTVWCGNLSEQVTEELLFELFLQAAPLERVKIPTDREGKKSNFAFITFKHEISVNYAQQLLNGTRLFEKTINVKPRNTNSVERNVSRSDYQNNFHQVTNIDLLRMGPLFQRNYEHTPTTYNDSRQGSWEHNSYRDREDRHMDTHRSYKKHEYRDNRESNSPNRRRHNYTDRKSNFNDRGNKRNNRHYY